eukprot:Ihof_evm5s393 gene=Ihof_evmTU5s393
MDGKKRRIPLADRIAALSNPTPVADMDEDPDASTVGRKDMGDFIYDEFDVDMEPSALRRQQGVEDDDPKYSGVKVSRKSMADQWEDEEVASDKEGDEEDEEIEGEEEGVEAEVESTSEQEGEGEEYDSDEEVEIGEGDEESEDDGEVEEEEEEGEGEGEGEEMDEEEMKLMAEFERLQHEENEGIQAFSKVDVREEVQKGEHVKAQLKLWDNLMESRIRLQKAVNISNKFAQPVAFPAFKEHGEDDLKAAMALAESNTKGLLSDLLQIQQAITVNGPDEEQSVASKKRKRPAEDSNVTEFWKYIKTVGDGFGPYRDATLTKWSNKVNLTAGGVGGNKQLKAINQTVVVQVQKVMADEERLIKRTQLKRSSYRTMGEKKKTVTPQQDQENEEKDHASKEEYDLEVFDDTDFYHQLLRDLIAARSKFGENDDPLEMGQKWMEVQKLRTKVKRKVDTKASKGRKI